MEIERATLIAWPAARRLSLYGWEFCATWGKSGRVNSIWPLAWTNELSVDDAIDMACAWCMANDIAPCFRVSEGCVAPPDLEAALERAGFAPDTDTRVMTLPLPGQAREAGAEPGPMDRTNAQRAALAGSRFARPASVELHAAPSEAFWAPLRDSARDNTDYAERRGIVERIAEPCAFALARLDERPAAIGLGVAVDGRAGVFLMRTAPWARRRGLARDILRSLLGWGAENGAGTAFLQVETDNDPAVRLYANEGFTTLYRYRYWRLRPSEDAAAKNPTPPQD